MSNIRDDYYNDDGCYDDVIILVLNIWYNIKRSKMTKYSKGIQ